MNGQIVLCKGINDGEELERSIRDLARVPSVSAECVGGSGGTYEIPGGTVSAGAFCERGCKGSAADYSSLAEETV